MKYDLVESDGGFHKDHWCVRINEGEFEGLTYQYDVVKLEQTEEGDVQFKFSTIIIENPNDKDTEDPELITLFGDILVDMIQQHLKEQDGENGIDDSNESVT